MLVQILQMQNIAAKCGWFRTIPVQIRYIGRRRRQTHAFASIPSAFSSGTFSRGTQRHARRVPIIAGWHSRALA